MLHFGREYLCDPRGFQDKTKTVQQPVPSPLASLKPKEEPKDVPEREDYLPQKKRQKVSLKL